MNFNFFFFGTPRTGPCRNHRRHEKNPGRGSTWLLHRSEATRPFAFQNCATRKVIIYKIVEVSNSSGANWGSISHWSETLVCMLVVFLY